LSSKHQIGLHLRINDTLSNMVQEALEFQLKIFQFFLVTQGNAQYLRLTRKERDEFVKARREHFAELFVHSSYWINPASNSKETFDLSKYLLKKEIAQAKSLEVQYIVLHAGSAKGHRPEADDKNGKKKGIATLASMLNSILKKESDVQILLENSAHGQKSIGNDFQDFIMLKELLDEPEKIGFCVDTAHAYSYGYPLDPIEDFITMLDRCMGLANIKLIHFNDTQDVFGSMQDRHEFPGKGTIGRKTLEQLLNNDKLKSVPKIIEGPDVDHVSTQNALTDIISW